MTWYLAVCTGCTPVLPQPFYNQAQRDTWADAHEPATGHRVIRAEHPDGYRYAGLTADGRSVVIAGTSPCPST